MQEKAEKLIKALGEIIQQHRKQTGKSAYKISAESSIPKPTWIRIEKAKYGDIKFTNIWKIAEGLDMYPDELIKELRLKLGDDFSLIDD